MEQDKGLAQSTESRDEPKTEERNEEKTEAEEAADQDRHQRLLRTIIRHHLTSIIAYLKIYEHHMEVSWNNEDFAEREDFLEALAGNVQAFCERYSTFLESDGWKDEEELSAEMKSNPWRTD
jgi:hypothetical protein